MKYILTFVVLALTFIGCGGGTDAPDEATALDVKLEYQRLPGGGRILIGTVENQSEKPIRNAQVQVSLFDANNRRVGSMSFTVKNLEPSTPVPFREPVDSDLDVRGARVRNILVL
ncbi:MAG: FxLYD domain-containing protein [Bacteroidota bacterium]